MVGGFGGVVVAGDMLEFADFSRPLELCNWLECILSHARLVPALLSSRTHVLICEVVNSSSL